MWNSARKLIWKICIFQISRLNFVQWAHCCSSNNRVEFFQNSNHGFNLGRNVANRSKAFANTFMNDPSFMTVPNLHISRLTYGQWAQGAKLPRVERMTYKNDFIFVVSRISIREHVRERLCCSRHPLKSRISIGAWNPATFKSRAFGGTKNKVLWILAGCSSFKSFSNV